MLNLLKFIFPDFTFYFGGGGGGPTTTKSETSNIPDYARPYVERMMGSTEKQVYTYGDNGQITGFQPYKPFEGETVAGFTPTQSRAMQGIQNYQLPGQTNAATQMTGYAGLGSMGAGQQYAQEATNPYATQAYMSPYMQNALEPQMREAARQSAIMGQQNQAQAVQQGAFGGSRSAIIEAERQRNLGQQQADIYGRGMQSAFEQARQAQQFGSELGLKGYGQGLQAAGQLGALGQQQYGQEMGLLGQQMDIGGKQQQYEQARLNQRIQDYATQQQYPFIQLGTLSNMLRGLPMQASTTQMYQAQPPLMQQAVGLAGAGANLYQAMKAEGGEIKEMASGGIATGADPYKLPSMMKKLSDQQLGEKMGGETDPETMGIAQAEKQRRDQVRAGAPKMMAGGGAVAFKDGSKDAINREDTEWAEGKSKDDKRVEKPVVKAPAKAPAKAPVSATPYQDMARQQLAALDAPSPEMDSLRKTRTELEQRTAGGVEGEMDRQQKLREKFGIDPAKLIAEERARYQEELKLNAEDYRKAEHLRYAQMFAKFGSTPGPTLKAALVAIDETVPDLLEDKAKVNAVRREVGKAMHELNKQEYQEKKGNFEAANTAYENAVGKITTLNLDLRKMIVETDLKKTQVTGSLAEREIAAISGEKQAQTSAGATITAARIREAGEKDRAKIQERIQERKDKEYANRVNAMASSELREFDKANFEAVESAKNTIAIEGANEKVKAIEQAKLDRIANERREKIRNLQERYPESNIGKELERDGGKPASGGIEIKDPKAVKYLDQYK
jgi:hypothetical protein